jgi:cytochrome c-type biogenesis protein CcmH
MRFLLNQRGPVLSLILALLLLGGTWAPALADEAARLINELMCPADCVMTLAACEMTEAVQMREFIRAKVAEGWSRQQISDVLVEQYGERLLAAPTKKGFNLTAWITPFAVILAGGVLIGVLVTTWIRQRKQLDARAKAVVNLSSSKDLETYRSRLAAELNQFQ